MTSLTNKEAIERLYTAFANRDGAAMTACYAPGAHFRDPAFGDLEGDDIGAMWRMLTGRARDLEITLREHEAEERTGTAHWIAATPSPPAAGSRMTSTPPSPSTGTP
jgi:ketosteroid isomerase-like protein